MILTECKGTKHQPSTPILPSQSSSAAEMKLFVSASVSVLAPGWNRCRKYLHTQLKNPHHPAHPLTAWLIIAQVKMTFLSCLNYVFHTCSSPYNIVSHTWAQTPQYSRCYHHQGCGRHLGFPWGSLRRGHTAGRTFCSRRIQGLEAWNTNVAVRHNHRQENIRAAQVL